MSVPASTSVRESIVLESHINVVWNLISTFNFSWWDLVDRVTFEGSGKATNVGSIANFAFKDGVQWTVQIVEYSNIKNFITFEVIQASTPLPFSSAIHTISATRVTASDTTFVQWVTDFSNDATAAVIADSAYKKLEAFQNLNDICHELALLSRRVSEVEARSRGNSMVDSPSRSRAASHNSIGSK
jgi:hypothetical protein